MSLRSIGCAAVIMAASMLAVGCGAASAPGTGGNGGGPTASAPPGGRPCARPSPSASQRLTVTGADNGKTLCVLSGATVLVFLHGTPASMWSRIRSSSPILRPRPSGVFTLARGVTGGSFEATGVGTARLSAVRAPHCGPGVQCAAQVFWVRLDVFGRA